MSGPGDAATVGEFIRDRGRSSTVRSGALLFLEEDRPTSVYICVSGSVRIFVTARSGREILMGFKDAGEQFGELSALTRPPRLASATAADECVVEHMSPGQLDDYCG
jgi:CRP-like cAMP-binding protein